MIRDHLFHKKSPADEYFRWRGGEVSRLEALSDAVFAITLTLLVVSLEVPKSYLGLRQTLLDLPVFLMCFTILMLAWRYHYQFFRRYGLEDQITQFLNACFLFLVLFYAYPLKFLATFLWGVIRGVGRDVQAATLFHDPLQQMSVMEQKIGMMYAYSFGILGVFGVLALMVLHAWQRRKVLELDALEQCLTLGSLRSHLITICVAIVALLVLWCGFQSGVAGVVYLSIPFLLIGNWLYTRILIQQHLKKDHAT